MHCPTVSVLRSEVSCTWKKRFNERQNLCLVISNWRWDVHIIHPCHWSTHIFTLWLDLLLMSSVCGYGVEPDWLHSQTDGSSHRSQGFFPHPSASSSEKQRVTICCRYQRRCRFTLRAPFRSVSVGGRQADSNMTLWWSLECFNGCDHYFRENESMFFCFFGGGFFTIQALNIPCFVQIYLAFYFLCISTSIVVSQLWYWLHLSNFILLPSAP